MNSNIQLSIPEPCDQNWDDMTANNEGRFCNSCSKTVIDFTAMSDTQIITYLEKRKGQLLCGQLGDDQLNRILISNGIKKSNPKLYAFIMSLMMLTSSQSFAQETKKETPVVIKPVTPHCGTSIESPPLAVVSEIQKSDTALPHSIIIRGLLSLRSSNEVLYILDGEPCSAALAAKLPADKTKRIDVLKGGQSATLFGPEGVNGAVVITTSFTKHERRKFLKRNK